MTRRTLRAQFVTAAFFVAVLAISAPLVAQTPVQVNTPGAEFSVEGRGGQATVDDVAGGRRFRGHARATLMLRATLRIPPSNSADPRLQRLVIHFRTSPSGPSLRGVELLSGTRREFGIETNLQGDYTTRETTKPDFVANVWAFAPIGVSAQSVVRLEVLFPVGFDSKIDPGEFVLSAVTGDFPRKSLALPTRTAIPSGAVTTTLGRGGSLGARGNATASPVIAGVSTGVIYLLASNNDLMWYGHTGREDGTFRWAAPEGKRIGTGWAFKQVFSGGNGVIYAITPGGDLLWYRHDGRSDGSFRWAAAEGKKIGTGWNFEHVFADDEGVIYAITSAGDLLWYRHDGRDDGSARWAAPQGKKVGTGWAFKHVFSGGDGVIYAVTAANDLLWYRHDGRGDGSFTWAAPEGKKVGTGWAFDTIFSGGGGVIYAVSATGDLLWYRHDGRSDGSVNWAAPTGRKVGSGWTFKDVFSG